MPAVPGRPDGEIVDHGVDKPAPNANGARPHDDVSSGAMPAALGRHADTDPTGAMPAALGRHADTDPTGAMPAALGRHADADPPSTSGAQSPMWRRFWRFPVTRIAMFAVLLACFFVVFAVPIEWVDRLDYWYWAAPPAALAALAVMGRYDHITFAGFGFNKPKVAARDMALGFLIGGATMALIVGLMAMRGWYHARPTGLTPALLSSLAYMLAVYFVIALAQDVIYVGYFFQTLERRWGADLAFAVTMVTFGLTHLTVNVPGATVSLKVIGALSIAVEAGILFIAAYLATRRLWMTIGIHWAWNFFEGPVFGTPVTGSNSSPSLFDSRLTGPAWATGGGFGPEASIPALVIGTAIGLVGLWVAYRRRHRKPSR